MAKSATRKRVQTKPAPAGVFGPLFALIRRFPLQAAATGAAALFAAALSALQVYDWFVTRAATESAIDVGFIDTELAPLSGGTSMVADNGSRVFTVGVKLRAQFSLKTRVPRAVINTIALVPVNDIPAPLSQEIAASAAASPPEENSWAGARPVDTYLAVVDGGRLKVVYVRDDGTVVPCPPENLLACEGHSVVIELSGGGDATHTLDVRVGYRDAALSGVAIVISYAIDGVTYEARSDTLFLHN